MTKQLADKAVDEKGIAKIVSLASASKVVDIKTGKYVGAGSETSDSCTSCYSCQCDGCHSCDCVCQGNCCDCDSGSSYQPI